MTKKVGLLKTLNWSYACLIILDASQFIVSSPNSNFWFPLMNKVFVQNILGSTDQVFFATFQFQGSKMRICYWFVHFKDFSNKSSPFFTRFFLDGSRNYQDWITGCATQNDHLVNNVTKTPVVVSSYNYNDWPHFAELKVLKSEGSTCPSNHNHFWGWYFQECATTVTATVVFGFWAPALKWSTPWKSTSLRNWRIFWLECAN